MFFGDWTVAWLPVARIKTWNQGIQAGFAKKNSKADNFKKAIQEVYNFLKADGNGDDKAKGRSAPPGWWCSPPEQISETDINDSQVLPASEVATVAVALDKSKGSKKKKLKKQKDNGKAAAGLKIKTKATKRTVPGGNNKKKKNHQDSGLSPKAASKFKWKQGIALIGSNKFGLHRKERIDILNVMDGMLTIVAEEEQGGGSGSGGDGAGTGTGGRKTQTKDGLTIDSTRDVLRQTLNRLKKMIPSLPNIPVPMNTEGVLDIYDRFFREALPRRVLVTREVNANFMLAHLLSWACGQQVEEWQAASIFPFIITQQLAGRGPRPFWYNQGEVEKLGLHPEYWPVPLTKAKVEAAEADAKAGKAPPKFPRAAMLQKKNGKTAARQPDLYDENNNEEGGGGGGEWQQHGVYIDKAPDDAPFYRVVGGKIIGRPSKKIKRMPTSEGSGAIAAAAAAAAETAALASGDGGILMPASGSSGDAIAVVAPPAPATATAQEEDYEARKNLPPAYFHLRQNLYVSMPRPKRMHKDDIPTCDCELYLAASFNNNNNMGGRGSRGSARGVLSAMAALEEVSEPSSVEMQPAAAAGITSNESVVSQGEDNIITSNTITEVKEDEVLPVLAAIVDTAIFVEQKEEENSVASLATGVASTIAELPSKRKRKTSSYGGSGDGGDIDNNNNNNNNVDLALGCMDGCLNRISYIHCDPKSCPCGDHCSNKPFHTLATPPMEVFLTKTKGWGIRAAASIGRGTFIVEYAGEVIDDAEVARRTEECRLRGEPHFYMMEMASGLTIDARDKGNIARLLNSSCGPNCETQKWHDASNGEIRVGIFALRDILPGEELTYDYKFQHFGLAAAAAAYKCCCGAPNCRGTMDANVSKTKDFGRRIEVVWPENNQSYIGTIDGYSQTSNVYTIKLDNGEVARLCLNTTEHRWLAEGETSFALPADIGLRSYGAPSPAKTNSNKPAPNFFSSTGRGRGKGRGRGGGRGRGKGRGGKRGKSALRQEEEPLLDGDVRLEGHDEEDGQGDGALLLVAKQFTARVFRAVGGIEEEEEEDTKPSTSAVPQEDDNGQMLLDDSLPEEAMDCDISDEEEEIEGVGGDIVVVEVQITPLTQGPGAEEEAGEGVQVVFQINHQQPENVDMGEVDPPVLNPGAEQVAGSLHGNTNTPTATATVMNNLDSINQLIAVDLGNPPPMVLNPGAEQVAGSLHGNTKRGGDGGIEKEESASRSGRRVAKKRSFGDDFIGADDDDDHHKESDMKYSPASAAAAAVSELVKEEEDEDDYSEQEGAKPSSRKKKKSLGSGGLKAASKAVPPPLPPFIAPAMERTPGPAEANNDGPSAPAGGFGFGGLGRGAQGLLASPSSEVAAATIAAIAAAAAAGDPSLLGRASTRRHPHPPLPPSASGGAAAVAGGARGSGGPGRRSAPTPPSTGLPARTILVAKRLTNSDCSKGRILLPRAAVEANLSFAIGKAHVLAARDHNGEEWQFTLQSWANGMESRRVYVLEHAAGFIQRHALKPDDVIGISCTPDNSAFFLVEYNTDEVCAAAETQMAARVGSAPHAHSHVSMENLLVSRNQGRCTRSEYCNKPAGHPGFCTRTPGGAMAAAQKGRRPAGSGAGAAVGRHSRVTCSGGSGGGGGKGGGAGGGGGGGGGGEGAHCSPFGSPALKRAASAAALAATRPQRSRRPSRRAALASEDSGDEGYRGIMARGNDDQGEYDYDDDDDDAAHATDLSDDEEGREHQARRHMEENEDARAVIAAGGGGGTPPVSPHDQHTDNNQHHHHHHRQQQYHAPPANPKGIPPIFVMAPDTHATPTASPIPPVPGLFPHAHPHQGQMMQSPLRPRLSSQGSLPPPLGGSGSARGDGFLHHPAPLSLPLHHHVGPSHHHQQQQQQQQHDGTGSGDVLMLAPPPGDSNQIPRSASAPPIPHQHPMSGAGKGKVHYPIHHSPMIHHHHQLDNQLHHRHKQQDDEEKEEEQLTGSDGHDVGVGQEEAGNAGANAVNNSTATAADDDNKGGDGGDGGEFNTGNKLNNNNGSGDLGEDEAQPLQPPMPPLFGAPPPANAPGVSPVAGGQKQGGGHDIDVSGFLS